MSSGSKTVDKALSVLAEMSHFSSVTPQQLSQHMGLNRSVVQRLLTTLVEGGLATREGGEYSLSSRLTRLGNSVQPAIRQASRPVLEHLSSLTGETAILQVLDDDSAIVLTEVVPHAAVALQARHEIGSRSPLDRTASGLVMLSAMEAAQREHILQATGSFGDDLTSRIAKIREVGYATTVNTLQAGVCGIAVAIVGPGPTIASIALIAPISGGDRLRSFLTDIQRAAADIESRLDDADLASAPTN